MAIERKSIPLESNEYFSEEWPKDAIFLHHTAGSFRPDYTVGGWERDTTKAGNVRCVATAYVIGGPNEGDASKRDEWDGVVVQCMPPEKWAHHLGVNRSNNMLLNKKSIGIELCNFGPLRQKDGVFYNYVNQVMPASSVLDLGTEYRGFRYYHRYSEKQIEACRQLILELSDQFEIDVKFGLQSLINLTDATMPSGLNVTQTQQWLHDRGLFGINGRLIVVDGYMGDNTEFAINTYHSLKTEGAVGAFEVYDAALNSAPGLYSHSNVRWDKYDLSPQAMMIDMIRSL